jgi:hypothetical protein
MAAPLPVPHAGGGSFSRAPQLRRILVAPQPTAAPPTPHVGGAARSVPTKEERMRRKKRKLVKTLKVKAEISEDIKYLGSFLFVLWITNI